MKQFKIPRPDLQIAFYHRLKEIRKTYLLGALLSTVAKLEISRLDKELGDYVSNASLQKMARWGLRGEIIFAVPYVLREGPKLLGYYRLLLGFSQKDFYGDQYGFVPFKPMEEKGRLSGDDETNLPGLCHALSGSAELLIQSIGRISKESVHDLTLITLGPQLRGGTLNILGNRATRRVFELVRSIVSPAIISSTDRSVEIQNAAGRVVRVEFSSDPDICIREELPSGRFRNLVAIEIKGGRDYSNIHNRIGEAEKSHQRRGRKAMLNAGRW